MQNDQPLTRELVTKRILSKKVEFGIKWSNVAEQLNKSIEWTVAACLGQMQLNTMESGIVASIFDLNLNERQWLETVPYKNALDRIPTDPLLYRLHEALGVYGPAMKEVIHEKFGDGIMSAIDFTVKVDREKSNDGSDRVVLNMSGKFLPYKSF